MSGLSSRMEGPFCMKLCQLPEVQPCYYQALPATRGAAVLLPGSASYQRCNRATTRLCQLPEVQPCYYQALPATRGATVLLPGSASYQRCNRATTRLCQLPEVQPCYYQAQNTQQASLSGTHPPDSAVTNNEPLRSPDRCTAHGCPAPSC